MSNSCLSSSSITNEDKDAEIRALRTDLKRLSEEVKEYKILLMTYRSDNGLNDLIMNSVVLNELFLFFPR